MQLIKGIKNKCSDIQEHGSVTFRPFKEIMTDRQTDQPTDQPTKQQTDRLTDIRVHLEVTLPEYYNRTLYEQKSAVTSILKGVKSFVQGLFL